NNCSFLVWLNDASNSRTKQCLFAPREVEKDGPRMIYTVAAVLAGGQNSRTTNDLRCARANARAESLFQQG
ncbi:hypothetical protein KC614_03000, partial [candidate division WWE3 bacterium]|nr:hypothetical protein [candidate division WWE3 bacterium]